MADLGPGVDYGLGKRRDRAYKYRFLRFKAALSDECSFYAMLMWNNRLAVLTGNKRTAYNALHFKSQCLQIMNERLEKNCFGATEVGTKYGALDLSNEAVGGLCNIIYNVPLVYSTLW